MRNLPKFNEIENLLQKIFGQNNKEKSLVKIDQQTSEVTIDLSDIKTRNDIPNIVFQQPNGAVSDINFKQSQGVASKQL